MLDRIQLGQLQSRLKVVTPGLGPGDVGSIPTSVTNCVSIVAHRTDVKRGHGRLTVMVTAPS